jgi:MFS family permease
MSGYLELLRNNPDYARLWYASIVSFLGDWFDTIVIAALVSEYSNGSGIAISGLLLARFLPPLLVSPFAGVLLDRMSRKKVLIFSDLSRCGIVLIFLLATAPDRLWLIYIVTVIQFALSALFEPGRSALTPSVVRKEDLVQANILGSITWSVMLAVGGALGGLVAALLGTSFALAFDAATFLISALLIMSIRTPEIRSTEYAHEAKGGLAMRDFVEGLRYAVHNPTVGASLLIKLGGNFGNIDTVMIVYATTIFVIGKDGTGSLGILWTAFGLGALVGPLIINRFSDGTVRVMRRLVVVGYALITIAWFVFGWAPVLAIAAAALFIRAMGSSVYWTYSSVIVQKTAPDRYLGRLFSLDQAGFQLAVVISTILTGAALTALGPENVRTIVYGTGFITLIPLLGWSAIVWWVERREETMAATVPVTET